MEKAMRDRIEGHILNRIMMFQAMHGLSIPQARELAHDLSNFIKDSSVGMAFSMYNNVIQIVHGLPLDEATKETVLQAIDHTTVVGKAAKASQKQEGG
jgi:hypothetical protein